jgi:threonine dehydrogenase-like Zn-dependent dehydrogenase
MTDKPEPRTKDATILAFTAPRTLGYLTRPLPAPGPDEVLVRTLFSGVSHGTEMNVYRGTAPQWTKRYDPDLRLFVPVDDRAPDVPARGYWTPADAHWSYPLAYGYANVGRVVAAGANVETVAVGDLVYAFKPHQTAYVAAASAVIPLPPLVNPACGVLYANLNTAYNGVLDADVRIDDTVVVFGQGVVGLLVTQFLRRGAGRRIVVVDPIGHRRDLARRFGADLALDPAAGDVARHVREITGGRGADVTIEASGSYAALHEAIRTAAPNTTVVAMSWYGGSAEPLRLADEFHHNRITVKSSQVGGIDPALSATHSLARRAANIDAAFADLMLAPLLSDVIPFAEASRGYTLVDEHGERTTQVVLAYDDGD